MALVIVDHELTKSDINSARLEYPEYIKITIDINKEIVVIGGEYHADAEKVLVEKFDSIRSDIWGGGYNIITKSFEVNAMLNLKPALNDSLEILHPKTRSLFLKIAKDKLQNIDLYIYDSHSK